MKYFCHATAEVSKQAKIGVNTKIWHFVQIRENAEIGKNCIIGKNVYIDREVKIGDNCKIQNNCSIYRGTVIKDGVFVGPHVVFANDKYPRAINDDGTLKMESDWKAGEITVETGASVGAHATILPDIRIGQFALIGAGSVVTKDVEAYSVVYGNPAKKHGRIDYIRSSKQKP